MASTVSAPSSWATYARSLFTQPDAAPFVPGHIDHDAAAGRGDQAQRQTQLDAAVAPQRPERITGQALRVQPHQNLVAVTDVAVDHGDVEVARRAVRRRAPRRPRTESGGERVPLRCGRMADPVYPGVECGETRRRWCEPGPSGSRLPGPSSCGPPTSPRCRRTRCSCAPRTPASALGPSCWPIGVSSIPRWRWMRPSARSGARSAIPSSTATAASGVVEESRSSLAVGQTVFAFHPHQSHFVADASGARRPRWDRGARGHAVPARRDGVADHVGRRTAVRRTCRRVRARGGRRAHRAPPVPGGGPSPRCRPRAWRASVLQDLALETVAPDDLPAALTVHGRQESVPLIVEASGSPTRCGPGWASSPMRGRRSSPPGTGQRKCHSHWASTSTGAA